MSINQGALFEKTAPWTPVKAFIYVTHRALLLQIGIASR